MQINEVRETLAFRGGTSGSESEMIEFLKNQLSEFADELWVDTLGNLICHIKGTGRKIAFYADVDFEGIMVHTITPEGSIYFNTLGDWPAERFIGKNIRFTNGTIRTISEFFPTEGEKLNGHIAYIAADGSADENNKKQIAIGDSAILCEEIIYQDSSCKAWYNHIYASVISMLLAIQRVKDTNCDAYFVFTVFSKVKQAGSITALKQIAPEVAISVAGIVGVCGAGPMIPYTLPGCIYQRTQVKKLISLTEQVGISFQPIVISSQLQDPWQSLFLTLERVLRSCGTRTATIGIPIETDENNRTICRNDDIVAVSDLIINLMLHCETI